MNAILNLGKYLYALPFAVFGIMHLMGAKDMAEMIKPPGGEIMVYITGVALIAAAVSIIVGKMDKLASVLLALMLILFIAFLHIPGISAGYEASMPAMLKDLALAGGALMYAGNMAKDKAVIG